MIKKFINKARFHPELILLSMMIMVVVMFIIPLPTSLIDFLIAMNLVMALTIFLASFYIKTVLEMSSFPSVLLISTIFRLAITISTSRLILANADAGDIIFSFGEFVIGDNLIVGFVIFSIVTVVQFIVITKGSERIAEVAARFSLDAMPGKQMSIDADLKAGVIDEAGVKKRRTVLEAESQLYGALDGAMKFIKGDAIAGILIIFVNLLGGISVGMLQHGMNMSEALSVYTILSIGDALVGQIPALLISISGGFIVTRVNNHESMNLGETIMTELFANNFILLVTAVLSVVIGLLPGFPLVVFLLLAAMFLGIYFYKRFQKKKGITKEAASADKDKSKEKKSEPVVIDGKFIPETLPLILTCHSKHKKAITSEEYISVLKRRFFIEYGIRLPDVETYFSESVSEQEMTIAVNEVEAAKFIVLPGMSKIVLRGDEYCAIYPDTQEINSAKGTEYWIPHTQHERAAQLGYSVRTALDEFCFSMSSVLTQTITELFGIQEAKGLLDDLDKKYPDLLKECYRNNTVQRITEVFQRLVQERISIRNMRLIIESLVQWAPKEKDPIMLVEHVRAQLARYISDKFSREGKIRAILLSHPVEETFREAIRQTATGSFINLSPDDTEYVHEALGKCLQRNNSSARDVILVVSMDIRRFAKKIVEQRYQELQVLSFSEISENTRIDIIDTIEGREDVYA